MESQDGLGNQLDKMKTVFDSAIETCNRNKNNDMGTEQINITKKKNN